ncbi:MAG: hypothetical protein ABSE53_03345 [Terracidiphilus sp.]
MTHAKMRAIRTNGNRRMENSQPVTMVITPAGLTKPQYTSTLITLIGGEVRTALIMDTQLTSTPPSRCPWPATRDQRTEFLHSHEPIEGTNWNSPLAA